MEKTVDALERAKDKEDRTGGKNAYFDPELEQKRLHVVYKKIEKLLQLRMDSRCCSQLIYPRYSHDSRPFIIIIMSHFCFVALGLTNFYVYATCAAGDTGAGGGRFLYEPYSSCKFVWLGADSYDELVRHSNRTASFALESQRL